MSSDSPLAQALADIKAKARPTTTAPIPPERYRPKVDIDTATGEGTVQGLFGSAEPPSDDDWSEALTTLGFDPDKHEIVGHLRVSAWDCPGHGTLYAHRANIRQKSPHALTQEDYTELLDRLYDVIPKDTTAAEPGLFEGIYQVPYWSQAASPDPGLTLVSDEDDQRPHPPTPRPDDWVTIATGDWHIGKGREAGGGTDLLVARYRDTIIRSLPHTRGRNVHLALMGDLIEGFASQGGAAVGTSDLALTEQLRIARHLVVWTVKTLAEYTSGDIRVSAVPGNHGDTTRSHEVPAHDSHDIAIPVAAQEVLAETVFADRLSWVYPRDTSEFVVHDLGGTRIASVHGHRSRRGSSPQTKLENWIKDAALNGSVAASADVVLAGHYHSPSWGLLGPRSVVYTPALETNSAWFRKSTHAENFTPGILLITTDGSSVPTSIHPIVASDPTPEDATDLPLAAEAA